MKYLLFVGLLFLLSCKGSPIIGDPHHPFVVLYKVHRNTMINDNEGMCDYFPVSAFNCGTGMMRSKVILPCSLYQIGDTIKPFKQ